MPTNWFQAIFLTETFAMDGHSRVHRPTAMSRRCGQLGLQRSRRQIAPHGEAGRAAILSSPTDHPPNCGYLIDGNSQRMNSRFVLTKPYSTRELSAKVRSVSRANALASDAASPLSLPRSSIAIPLQDRQANAQDRYAMIHLMRRLPSKQGCEGQRRGRS